MAKSVKGVKITTQAKDMLKSGYWMYKDGSSFWGVGVMRGAETPILTTREIHKAETVAEKLEWYKEANEANEANERNKS